jgi:hypothetical protein
MTMAIDSEHRKCSTCLQVKPKSLFYTNTANKSGVYAACKDCIEIKEPPGGMDIENQIYRCRGACAQTKPKSMFYAHASNKSGVQSICKDCQKLRRKQVQAANDVRMAEMRERLGLPPVVPKPRGRGGHAPKSNWIPGKYKTTSKRKEVPVTGDTLPDAAAPSFTDILRTLKGGDHGGD